MARNSASQQMLQRIPKKWAVAIVVALIAYALFQPFANSRLGWRLPSLAGGAANQPIESHAGDSNLGAEISSTPAGTNQQNSQKTEHERDSTFEPEIKLTAPQSATGSTASKPTDLQESELQQADPKQKKPDASSDLLYGVLKDTGREVYVSPAGLRYTRGSEEGHRLKHLERHLKDIPDRPGKHGVFDGDMAQVLRWIDDAYTRGKQGAKGVRKRDEDRRTVYEVPFTKTIGYIGGRDGKRDNNPDAKRLRLVVDGDQVITAFPF